MSSNVVFTKQTDGTVLNILGTQTRFLCSAEQTNHAWSLMEVSLPKGTGAPPHSHPWDEAYYVVAGEVRFVAAGEVRLLGAGDFLYAPANTVHAFEGHSTDTARVIIFDAPAHAARFFQEVDSKVKRLPEDIPTMIDIGNRHQVVFAPNA